MPVRRSPAVTSSRQRMWCERRAGCWPPLAWSHSSLPCGTASVPCLPERLTTILAGEAELSTHELNNRGLVPIENLLANAQRQARERGLDRFAIVDVDSHHYEDASWNEILPYVDDDGVRAWSMTVADR